MKKTIIDLMDKLENVTKEEYGMVRDMNERYALIKEFSEKVFQDAREVHSKEEDYFLYIDFNDYVRTK